MNESTTTQATSDACDHANDSPSAGAGSAPLAARAIALSPVTHTLIFVAIILYCFGRTLGSYFLADDFGEICYIHRIFHGEPALLWSNFTGNYMQIPGMSVYRPFLLLTLVFDYMMWGANALGYYLTNILYFAGNCLVLYALVLQLTASWSGARSRLTAFFSAALFASCPLHNESISWILGRVDIACCFYYLLSLYLFVRWKGTRAMHGIAPALDSATHETRIGESNDPHPVGAGHAPPAWTDRPLIVGSIAGFWAGLFIKEMAIGLPIVASAIALLFPGDGNRSHPKKDLVNAGGACPAPTAEEMAIGLPVITSSLDTGGARTVSSRLRSAVALTWPYWLSTAIYFSIRYLALGTFAGGYTGGIGASQLGGIIQKWSDLDTIKRIVFPFNDSVFHGTGVYPQLLEAIYLMLGVAVVIRLLGRAVPWSWLLFYGIWLATAAAPIYQLWGLGYNLEGSRFLFFLSVPLCVITAVFLLAPAGPESDLGERFAERLTVFSIIGLSLLAIVFSRVSYLNNIPWVHAGKTVKSVQQQAQKLAEGLAPDKKLIVLGIPKEQGGAHIILNGATFTMLMHEPFLKVGSAQHFVTFDPILFGDPDLINAARFKQSLSDSSVSRAFFWKPAAGRFVPITMRGGDLSKLSLRNMGTADGIILSGMNLDPLTADFLALKLSYSALDSAASVSASWHGSLCDGVTAPINVPVAGQDRTGNVLIPLSRNWRWYAAGTIQSLSVHLNGLRFAQPLTADLLPASRLAPSLTLSGATRSLRGVFEPVPPAAAIRFDGSAIPGASATQIEITRPNFFFEQWQDRTAKSAVMTTLTSSSAQGSLAITKLNFPEHAYYQIRARCLHRNGSPLGAFSDAETLRF